MYSIASYSLIAGCCMRAAVLKPNRALRVHAACCHGLHAGVQPACHGGAVRPLVVRYADSNGNEQQHAQAIAGRPAPKNTKGLSSVEAGLPTILGLRE